MELIKRCKICNDSASGFNYKGGLSCESCKVFFCRNSQIYEKLKCRKGGNCQIDMHTRRCCSKCRMDKCIQNGMVRKVESRSSETNCSPSSEEGSETSKLAPLGIDKVLEHDILRSISVLEDFAFDYPPLPEVADRKKRQAMDLNQMELEEIAKVQEAFSGFGNEQMASVIREAKTVQECMYGPEIYVRLTINFCRQFDAFNKLSSQDQILLIKLFVFDVITLRFAFNYDAKTNSVIIYGDNNGTESLIINCDLGRELIKNQELVEANMKLALIIKESLEDDETIRDLYSAVLLFRPRDGFSCLETMRYHFYYYQRLLQRYLEAKYHTIQQANKKYSHLIAQIKTIENIKRNKFQMAEECKFDLEMPQLIKELYNLI